MKLQASIVGHCIVFCAFKGKILLENDLPAPIDVESAARHVALAAPIKGYSANIVVVSSAVHSVGSAGFLVWHAFRFASDAKMAPRDEASAAALHCVYMDGVVDGITSVTPARSLSPCFTSSSLRVPSVTAASTAFPPVIALLKSVNDAENATSTDACTRVLTSRL